MSKVYDSLLQEMQERLHRVRLPSTQVARLHENQAITINDELDQFQKNIGDQVARFKNAIAEGEALVNDDLRNAAETIQRLKDDITVLETERTNNQQALHAKEKDIAGLREHIDGQLHEVRELQYALEESKLEVASHVKQIDALTETFTARVSDLDHRLLETERIVGDKESNIQFANERLTAAAREFNEELEGKENLLKTREAEITKLRGQLQLLTHGVKEMSSFFTQVDAFGDSRRLLEAMAEASREELTSDCSQSVTQKTRFTAAKRTEETMPAECFDDLIAELTDAVGPIAKLILRDQLEAFGASFEAFPKGQVTELLDLLADEILEPHAKAHFRARFPHSHSQIKGETVGAK
jgi:chromosome segregation ATPase